METVQLRRFIYEKDSSPGSLCALYACRGCGRQRCEGIQLHALQDSETLKIAEIDTGLTFQFLAHTFERPHRLWCLHLSNCEEVQYTTEGISLWVDVPHKVARWFLDQNSVVMVVVALPLLGLFAVLANPAAACLSSLVAVLVAARLAVRVKAA